MKIKRLLQLSLASILSVVSLLMISMPAAFAAGPFTCTWTGGGSDSNFSTAANWSGCNGSSPQPADNDNLIFDNSSLGSNKTLTNDVSLLGVGNIQFTGTGSFGYIITGNTITVNGNLTNAYSSNQLASIEASINFTGSLNSGQATDQAVGLGAVGFSSNPTLTFTNGSNSFSFPFSVQSITGTGNIVVANGASLQLLADSPSWTGSTTVNSGGVLSFANPSSNMSTDALGVSSNTLTIQNGGVADFSNITGTIPQNIIVAGNGSGSGAILYNGQATKSNPTPEINLTGTTTLQGNTTMQVSQSSTVTVSGPIVGSFTLTLTSGSLGKLVMQSSNNQSATQNGTYSDSPSSTAAAPGTPDTGLAAITAHPLVALASSLVAAFMIVIIAHRLKPARR